MSNNVETITGRYVYAFVRSKDAAGILAVGMKGLLDQAITADIFGQLAIISSPIETDSIRPKRKLLAAHQQVVADIAVRWDMLPVSFGLVVSDEDQLAMILNANQENLLSMLDRVGNKVELNLALKWTSADVYGQFVVRHPELLASRDRLASGQATREEMIEIGRAFEGLLNQERESHLARMQNELTEIASEIQVQDPKSEAEIFRINCLIDREVVAEFESIVNSVAQNYDDSFGFALSGPWPPYSFVNLKIGLE